MSNIKIASAQDLAELQRRLQDAANRIQTKVYICTTGCRALGALTVAETFRQKLAAASLDATVRVIETGCIGICARAPVMRIEPAGFVYGGVTPEDIAEIITQTLQAGKPVERLCVKQEGTPTPSLRDIHFYQKQQRLVLENCGRVDPRSIEDAIAQGAYRAAVDALHQHTPEQIIHQVIASGLRGRGGAGFPTGLKWKITRAQVQKLKVKGQTSKSPAPRVPIETRQAQTENVEAGYIICNADEGDPGAFMDRALLEGDPHRVIEGMIIAAYALGVHRGFVYVRAEYPIAVEHIHRALAQAREYGLLGDNIAGTGFAFDLAVRMGAGAFVCGEETALIASLEGKRGMPNPRPPYPAEKGYRGQPTNINNVETFANVPVILRMGADAYSQIGTEQSKGTKIFALAGKVNNTGLVEVPMGATLREIVYDIGGGIPGGKEFKAAQMGGPSGGCIPAQFLDYPIDYDTVEKIGAIMGSGGLIVMDESTCMVDVARYFINFCQAESCGKCIPCREGTRKLLEILETICAGNGTDADLVALETLATYVKKTSLCGLGQTAPNPVLSTLNNFREEYLEHIRDKKCRAGVCKAMQHYAITDACTGCGVCKRKCPVGAIAGEKKQKHIINPQACIKCGVCYDACKFDAIIR